MVVGLVGLVIGFSTRPGSIEEVKEMMAAHDAHGGGHGESHAVAKDHGQGHGDDAHGGEFFFFMIALGVLAFYAIQFASQAGWSPVLFRVMEAITAYLVPGGIILFVILALSGFHVNHLFVWADPEVVAHDKLIQGKAGWLNGTAFIIRAAIFLGGWLLYRHFAIKYSLKQDEEPEGNKWYKKSFKISAGYVFASLFVSGITTIALITIYLKSKGYMDFVNNSHIHDLAKFMFGISIFWTYLWFSQFMLIWYGIQIYQKK